MKITGTRWAVEESSQAAEGQGGLDQYQVRGWTLWYRHITLAMLTLALLATIAAAQPFSSANDRIPPALPEIRRLLAAIVLTRHHSITGILRWSDWRRHHQATARHYRYQRRSQP
ncbi:hypothetical protein DMB42_05865 [Nonomuraea sp. WAC 01424]|uniref:hypothetical protein n=1 Tax=Nonomuraea sp. WAC 01424 TaxID=2203200 RepID=UPI000F76EA08|nr:hypothetical protein DMB42_05865 [Nonomuraea sp. WAC 01424]